MSGGEASARLIQDVDALETLFIRLPLPWTLAAALITGLGLAGLAGWAPAAALAAFAGAMIVPMSSVDPNMGTPWVITAFMVVLGAGVSLPALWISGLALAAAQVLATFYIAPVVGGLLVIALPILLMRFYPEGIAPLLKAR